MCRMLAFWGTRDSLEMLEPLLEAFVDACSNDRYLERVTEGAARCHCDGWGYAMVLNSDGGSHIVYERFYTPSEEEHRGTLIQATRRLIALARDYQEVTLLMHCRRAGRTEPKGVAHSHPYEVETNYHILYFAHNGSFRKDDLAMLLGLHPQLFTDSALAARLYARLVESGGEPLDALRRLAFYTRTAFNTVTVMVERVSGRTMLTYSALTCSNDPARLDYYRIHVSATHEYFVYASSTVAEHPSASVLRWEKLSGGNGRVGYYERGLHLTQSARCPPVLE